MVVSWSRMLCLRVAREVDWHRRKSGGGTLGLTGDPLHVLPGEVSVDYINLTLDGATIPATNCLLKNRGQVLAVLKIRFDGHQ